jgi:DNA-binding transcriptional MocR family regulator
LIDAHVGIGTTVRGRVPGLPIRGGTSAEMTMNLPPEPVGFDLVQRMQAEATQVLSGGEASFFDLMRYQDFGGSAEARAAGASWLESHIPHCSANHVLVGPGIHGVLLALISMLCRPGETLCVESLAYPGIKAITAQLGVRIQPLGMDRHGVRADEFEHACKTAKPRALVCNPNIQNPTTITMPLERRREIADIASHYSVPIVEDDAYGKLLAQPLPTLMSLAPELTWYVAGLSKCLGAGLRMSYIYAPDRRLLQKLSGALRATTVMSSPISAAIATRWVQTGSAQAMLQAIREESMDRQMLASEILADFDLQFEPEGFHSWLPLRSHWNPLELSQALRNEGLGCVASMAFSTDADPPPAVRLCLGGTISRVELRQALEELASMLERDHPPVASAG